MGLLSCVRIVLVETSHPGNIGACARAMKSMGLHRLYLVRPKRFPSADATARAAGADDLLQAATVCDDLTSAIRDCGFVVATSARQRHISWPVMDARECAAGALEQACDTEVALVFGRENAGLTNDELDQCHAMVTIPADPGFQSLNLAAAVQVLAYELRYQALAAVPPRPEEAGQKVAGRQSRADGDDQVRTEDACPAPAEDPRVDRPASGAELDGLYRHMEQTLIDIEYLDPRAPKLLMRRLRRLFNRAQMLRSELNIVRGVLSAIERVRRRGA